MFLTWCFCCGSDFGEAALKIVGVTTDDDGIYTCIAVNDMGSASSSASLRVLGKWGPQVKSLPPRPPLTWSDRGSSSWELRYLHGLWVSWSPEGAQGRDPRQLPHFLLSVQEPHSNTHCNSHSGEEGDLGWSCLSSQLFSGRGLGQATSLPALVPNKALPLSSFSLPLI